MGNWSALKLSDLVPATAINAVTKTTDVVQQFLTALRTAIATEKAYAAALDSSSNVDVLGILVQAIKDIVESLLQATKVHALFVPIPKQTDPQTPALSLPTTLADVGYSLGFDVEQAGLTFADGTSAAYATLSQAGRGGNRTFFQTVVQSLYDELDPNRPLYLAPNDAIACTAIVVGAASAASLIQAANTFNRLFQPETSFAARLVPVPQNIRVSPISAPGATTMGVGVYWDSPKTSFDSPYFPTVSMRVKKYAVIRSTARTAPLARNVLDFFDKRDLTEGMTSTDEAKSSTVIAVGSTFNSSFIDNDDLDPTKTYYYCVAWQVAIDEAESTTVLPWDLVSAVRKVVVRRVPPNVLGTPPDWSARGSVIDLLPDVAAQIRTALAQVTSIGERSSGDSSNAVTEGLNTLQKNVDALATRLDALNQQAAQIGAMFADALPGLYVTSFTGIGGNTFLVGELASRLNDTSDTSRPPFDSNEYVMGVVLVVGGPRLVDVQPIANLLSSLFGSAQPDDPLHAVLDSIDGLIDHQELRIFGPDAVHPILAPDGQPIDPSDPLTSPHGPGALPPGGIDPLTGLPPAPPPSPAISNAGAGITSLDPTNPDAGFTNQPAAPSAPADAVVSTDLSPESGQKKYTPF